MQRASLNMLVRTVFLIILFRAVGFAQSEMLINGVTYRIGMTKAEVTKATPSAVQIKDMTQDGPHGTLMLFIQRRSDFFDLIGQVDLKNNRVFRIVRPVGSFAAPEAYALSKVLYESFARVKQ